MNREDVKIGDKVVLPFGESGTIVKFLRIPWGFDTVVKLRKVNPHFENKTNQHLEYKTSQLTHETAFHWEFRHWEDCFKQWEELVKKHGNKAFRLVISTHWTTSGYWIEPNFKPFKKNGNDIPYYEAEILSLRRRVRKEINNAALEERMPEFTI